MLANISRKTITYYRVVVPKLSKDNLDLTSTKTVRLAITMVIEVSFQQSLSSKIYLQYAYSSIYYGYAMNQHYIGLREQFPLADDAEECYDTSVVDTIMVKACPAILSVFMHSRIIIRSRLTDAPCCQIASPLVMISCYCETRQPYINARVVPLPMEGWVRGCHVTLFTTLIDAQDKPL